MKTPTKRRFLPRIAICGKSLLVKHQSLAHDCLHAFPMFNLPLGPSRVQIYIKLVGTHFAPQKGTHAPQKGSDIQGSDIQVLMRKYHFAT